MGRTTDPSSSPGENRWITGSGVRGADYDARFEELARAGHDVHGEAAFMEALTPTRVLDAGCGTGRVAIELARRGVEAVGVDLDPAMLAAARAKAPQLEWVEADLVDVDLGRTFDAVVLAGNVMIFLTPGTEGAVLSNLARHLVPGGRLVAGFQLEPGRLDLAGYDRMCAHAGLALVARYATWDAEPWSGSSGYAVSVHRLG